MRQGGIIGYDLMQVCLNGHKISGRVGSEPERRETFCNECGQKTITECPSCGQRIRGDKHTRGGSIRAAVPKYCTQCGAAYPWQAAAIENLRAVLQESELDGQERQEFEDTLPDLLHDTPKTESAALKARRILGKIGRPLYDTAMKVLTDVLSETAKKALGI